MGTKEQTRFWYVHATTQDGSDSVALAVAAFTQRSAQRQARQVLGPHYVIEGVNPVYYAHAWTMNLGWRPNKRTM